MNIRLVGLLSACLIMSATAAVGANREGQFSLSPVIGGYTFDGKQHLNTNFVYGARAGYNFTDNFGIEALFDYVHTMPTKADNKIDMFRYGGELLYHFMPENTLVPYLAVGFSGISFNSSQMGGKTRGAADYGVGAKYFVKDNLALRADVRHLIYDYNAETMNNLEYTVGAYIAFGGVKPVAKAVEPPPLPAPAPKPAEAPPAAPKATLSAAPVAVAKGQTVTLDWKSENATGCDIQPGIGSVPPQGSRNVSPVASTTYKLSCSGAGGAVSSSADVKVSVPPAAPIVEKAKPTPAAVKFCNRPAILEIHFDNDKADIKPQYHAELKSVGDFLKEFPASKGEISGHTSSTGTKSHNQKLSERRAASVAKYIEDNFGIQGGRMTTKGYGDSRPIASNKTKEGQAKNRRIEANFTCE